MEMKEPDVGDILCTRDPGIWARLIRLGAALLDKPNTVNHIIVVHHRDSSGTLWGIEARPGGVGYIDTRMALQSRYTLTNIEQPKTEGQRFIIAKAAEGLLGTPYDWQGIVEAGMEVIGAQELWKQKWGSKKVPPAHVICSSFADWLYDYCDLPSPGSKFDRNVTPGDWAKFMIEKGWQ
jgi:hypothetical protein